MTAHQGYLNLYHDNVMATAADLATLFVLVVASRSVEAHHANEPRHISSTSSLYTRDTQPAAHRTFINGPVMVHRSIRWENISGRGRLTLKEVDSIQHYYGLAIRKNLSSGEDMKRAIWAIYFHKLNTEDNPQHALCPLGEDSWRGYNRSIDLTEKDLLKKFLHGRTQNPNESFYKCIWERIPKTVFVGIETLKFGVMDAVICFNDGYVSRIKVFEALGIKPGYNTERALLIIDNKQIFEAERIVNKVSLEARNKKRSLKRKMDKQNLDEENEYQAGKY
ncbi:uncharacterized protein TNCV_2323411 [Trichonephila clavipes]|nr:uncharacterized protein TNCV_2323411 [Trichonephila clavipes]